MWIPPSEDPLFKTNVTPNPMHNPAKVVESHIGTEKNGKRSNPSRTIEIPMIDIKLEMVNHLPNLLYDIKKNGKFTKKNSTPHDHGLTNVNTVASPAVPPKVSSCKAKNFKPIDVRNKPKITKDTIFNLAITSSHLHFLYYTIYLTRKK